MPCQWRPEGTADAVDGPAAAELLDANRGRSGQFVLQCDDGRTCVVTHNSQRVFLAVFHPDGRSLHAGDPDAEGESTGFVLDNGQIDTYDDRDTLHWGDAVVALTDLVAGRPGTARWEVD